METLKKCSSCKDKKLPTEFHACKTAKDGLYTRCKACTKIQAADYYQANKTKLNEQNKWRRYMSKDNIARRKARKEVKAFYEQSKEANKKYYEQKKEARKIANKKHYEKRCLIKSKKSVAFHAVNHAVKSGSLIRPTVCPVCSAEAFNVAYQKDYTKPLEVKWMCIECYKSICGK